MPLHHSNVERAHSCALGADVEAEQTAEIARTPLRRIVQPEDQARVICFLASTDADFVTGVTIDVTGGQ
jgi:NAD(P)-dependent dehydrogenase (short-subunit alcohol dehydrogenase family)